MLLLLILFDSVDSVSDKGREEWILTFFWLVERIERKYSQSFISSFEALFIIFSISSFASLTSSLSNFLIFSRNASTGDSDVKESIDYIKKFHNSFLYSLLRIVYLSNKSN